MNLISAILLYLSWPFSPNEEAIREITSIKEQMKGYYSTNLDSAAILAEMILIKSKEAGYHLGQAKGEFAMAYVFNEQGKISKAIPHFLEALNLYSSLNNRDALSDQANICITLGSIYRQHHSLDKAISFYDQGIQFALETKDIEALIKLYNNKAVVYRRKGEYVKAIELQTQKLELVSESNYDAKYKSYNQLGLIHRDLQDYDKARNWYQKIIDMESGINQSKYRARAYHNIATTYQIQKKGEAAWNYYELALKEKILIANPNALFITYHDMAELANEQNRTEIALSYAQRALAIVDKVPNTPDYYKIFKLLSHCVTDQNPAQAIAYANQYMEANEAFNVRQKVLIDDGDRYKVELITSNYFNNIKRQKEQLKMAWTMSCAAAFIFLAVLLTIKLYRIYSYRSPELALSHIKSQNEMIYLLDLFRKEKEEMKNTLRQKE